MGNFEKGDSYHPVPSFDELLRLKALGHQRTEECRRFWYSRISSMSDSEREMALQRFSEMADRVASQFGKSRRFVWEDEA